VDDILNWSQIDIKLQLKPETEREEKGMTGQLWRNSQEKIVREEYTLDRSQSKAFLVFSCFYGPSCLTLMTIMTTCKFCDSLAISSVAVRIFKGDLPQSAADESGTSSLTAIFAGGSSVVRALVALSRGPVQQLPANQL